MNSIVTNFKARFNEATEQSGKESGMEAAQVILILVLVVVILIPIAWKISDALRDKGSLVEKCITGVNGTTSDFCAEAPAAP